MEYNKRIANIRARYSESRILEAADHLYFERAKEASMRVSLLAPGDAKQYLLRSLECQVCELDYEVFGVIYLNNQHKVLGKEVLATGTIDGAAVYPREVVKSCLKAGSCDVVLFHNHPSGIAEPSQSDRAITDRLKNALDTVDIRILDHIVIGSGKHVSFAERGWI